MDQVLEESYIRYTCATFLTSALCLRDCSSFLHVFQGEIAAKIRTEGGPVRWAGSSAATTCVIAVFVDPHTELASVCHFDNFTSCSASCIEECLDGMDAPFLYLVGGYSDTRGLGPGTCEQLLAYFHKLKMNISLQLCCVAKLNTDALGAPTCQSLAVDLRSLAAYPAVFANKGPLAIPRLAQMWVQDGQPRLNNIFDPCQQQIVLRLEKGGGDRRLLRALLHLADISPSQFLHQVSTSPEHEEPEFLGGREVHPCKAVTFPASLQPGILVEGHA